MSDEKILLEIQDGERTTLKLLRGYWSDAIIVDLRTADGAYRCYFDISDAQAREISDVLVAEGTTPALPDSERKTDDS